MKGARVRAVGLLTGWGEGPGALPADAARAAGRGAVVALPRPALDGDRFRRATRECLLGVAAVEAMLREGGIDRAAIAGSGTALIYVTAAAYGSSNQSFIVAGPASPAPAVGGRSEKAGGGVAGGPATPARAGGGPAGTLHFPYTAPSAVPAEVAIEFGLTGAYVILVGGAATTIDALWQAGVLLERGHCQRALVLAVETFEECAALWARGRWLTGGPLVETAACALLVPGERAAGYAAVTEPSPLETAARARAGETLACAPLVALALAREAGDDPARLTGQWRRRRAGLDVAVAARAGTA